MVSSNEREVFINAIEALDKRTIELAKQVAALQKARVMDDASIIEQKAYDIADQASEILGVPVHATQNAECHWFVFHAKGARKQTILTYEAIRGVGRPQWVAQIVREAQEQS
jgi:hypothetical protein